MTTDIKLSEVISRAEIKELSERSNVKALGILVFNWSLIALVFAVTIVWTAPIIVFVGVLILGGRQLGLGVLTHDCAHNAFFDSISLNNFIGHYLCGAPMNISVYEYREYHMRHHRFAGSDEDPDRVFVDKYPVSRASLKRKLIRDITGQTGLRNTLSAFKRFTLVKNYPWLMFHVALFTGLLLLDAPWVYLMWWVAEIFVYPLLARIRQIGEHGVAINRDSSDERENTSTTLCTWWERLLIAPNYVNYHTEHHLLANIPSYNLAKLHKILLCGGFYEGFECISFGFMNVLKQAHTSN